MMDINSILIWQKFNKYRFIESTHSYYYEDKRVGYSVTQFIHKFYEQFDSETISKKYAKKHGLNQEDVLAEWKKSGDISSTTGTIIHSYLENAKRGKYFDIDYSKAEQLGIYEDVKNRVEILLPKADAFHNDTKDRLFPIQLEYTVGIKDIIAGNIDLLCWNDYAKEFQIWDYKNTKKIEQTNWYGRNMLESFSYLPDCNYNHYSVQLNMYKAIIQRELGIQIGGCFIVHFDYTKPGNDFIIYPCEDLQYECNIELEKLIKETSRL